MQRCEDIRRIPTSSDTKRRPSTTDNPYLTKSTRCRSALPHSRLWLAASLLAGSIGLSACNGGSSSPTPQGAVEQSPPNAQVQNNRLPTLSGTPATEATQGVEYVFTPSVADADNDELTFMAENLPPWATFDASTGEIRGTPGAEDLGSTADITITVSDGQGTASLSSFSIAVLQANVTITGTMPEDVEWGRLSVGELVYVDDTIEFMRVPGEYRTLNYLKTVNADQFFNDAVAIEFTIDRPVEVLIGYDDRASDVPDWLDTWADTGKSIDASGISHKLYSKRFEAGTVSLGGNELGFSMYSVIVDDGTGAGNSAPTISGNPPASVSANREYMFRPTATDIDGDAVSFGADDLPAWATLDSGSGEVFGTPLEGDVGSYEVVIYASDGQGSSPLPTFTITVHPPGTNSEPSVSGVPPNEVVRGDQYNFVPTANDPDGDELEFSATNLPRWASLRRSSGIIRGTPGTGDIGTYPDIVLHVTDGEKTASLPPFTVSVVLDGQANKPANTVPTISGNAPSSATQGEPYAFTPTANDLDGDPLTFSVNNRPPWAAFSSVTGRLSGTPRAGDVGNHDDIRITVSDGQNTATLAAFSIVVDAVSQPVSEPDPPSPPPPPANSPPTISGSPAPSVTQDQAYSFTPQASDDDVGDTLSFTISNRPSWATFNGVTGNLSGTPDAGDVGSYNNIVIRVSDGADSAALPAFSITVEGVTPPPGSDPPPPPPPPANTPPTISGSPATSVDQDEPYSFTPQADDDDPDDTLSFTISNRPSWATFSGTTGRLSGTPGAGDVGTYNNIVIRVSDGKDTVSLPSFSIEVVATATGSATLSWTAPTRRADGSNLGNDLDRFKIYWGTSQGNYSNTATIDAGTTTYFVDELTPATWYFVVTAIDKNNLESQFSNVASKTISP